MNKKVNNLRVKEKKVETSKIEGEITSNYQFIFDKPKPFSKQFLTLMNLARHIKKVMNIKMKRILYMVFLNQ